MKTMKSTFWTSAVVLATCLLAAPAVDAATILTNSDGVIRNSLCVGFDCPNSPSFSDTTILLVENNTRIKFDDTSTASSFPRNDWELQANSSSNGGGEFFAINDCGQSAGGGCADDPVFKAEAGARANSVYIESDGDVGFGTSNPSVNLHVVDGDSPALRLQQDGSSGFAPYTWDVAGNETNFFVRDVTGGSGLPFRIKPGAGSNAIFIEGSGDVGLGTSAPEEKLHVRETTATETFVKVENANAAGQVVGVSFENSSGVEWRFQEGAAGAVFNITRVGSGGNELTVNQRLDGAGPATLVVDGSVNATNVAFPSSRELKTEFQPLDVQDVLARVAGLEMTSWRFKKGPAVRHIGPIAEDFHAAFPLAPNDKQVSAIDVGGVALAAIQGLSQKLAVVEAEKAALQSDLEELRALVERLTRDR